MPEAPAGDKEKKPDRLPQPPSRNLSIDQLIQYWSGIDQEFRPRILGYLYRLWPLIVREPAYIDKLSNPPDGKEAFLQEWGTGEYEIRLTDLDKPKSSEICRARWKFSESYSQCPPILEPVELDLNRKENATYVQWLRAKGQLRLGNDQANNNGAPGESIAVKALADIATKKAEGKEPDAESTAAAGAVKIMASAATAAIDTVRAQQDPAGLAKLLELMKGQSNGMGDLLPLLIKMQSDSQTQTLALITKLLELQKPAAAVSPTSQVKELAELITALKPAKEAGGLGQLKELAEVAATLRDAFGGGDDGPRPRSGKWYDAVLSNPDVMNVGKTLAGAAWNFSLATMRPRAGFGQAPPAETAPVPAGPIPGTPPGPAGMPPQAAGGFPQQQQPGFPPPPPGGMPPQPQPTEQDLTIMALLEFLQPRFPAFMAAMNQGLSGADFAQELFEANPLLGGMDLGQHAQIKEIGRDKIVGLLGMAPPEVKQMLAGRQTQLIQFIDEFLAWTPAEDDEDEEPPPPRGAHTYDVPADPIEERRRK